MFETLGNLGDFIGGIAVLATLMYLAFQIRLNTDEVRNASVQSILQQSTQLFGSELSLRAKTLRSIDQENWTADDRELMMLFFRRNFQLFEQVYLQYRSQRIAQEVMDAYESRIRSHLNIPLAGKAWERYEETYTRSFVAYVNGLWERKMP